MPKFILLPESRLKITEMKPNPDESKMDDVVQEGTVRFGERTVFDVEDGNYVVIEAEDEEEVDPAEEAGDEENESSDSE